MTNSRVLPGTLTQQSGCVKGRSGGICKCDSDVSGRKFCPRPKSWKIRSSCSAIRTLEFVGRRMLISSGISVPLVMAVQETSRFLRRMQAGSPAGSPAHMEFRINQHAARISAAALMARSSPAKPRMVVLHLCGGAAQGNGSRYSGCCDQRQMHRGCGGSASGTKPGLRIPILRQN